ncbi:MAG: ribosome biogenesis GTP-binding protein YihA/YsxC, partial [Nitrospinales bacterium]
MKIISAEFLTGAVSATQYPRGVFPEFAFVGRSNVGKSSLINSLLNRKKLVRTSRTPGKTQTINFFKINGALVFADLPGYGYAKVPLAVKKRWKNMIERYILNRKTLTAVVFIVDIRREPTDLDLVLKDWLEANEIEYVLAATKSDKLSQSEQSRQLGKIKEGFFKDGPGEALAYSSKTGRGRKELWRWILKKGELKSG